MKTITIISRINELIELHPVIRQDAARLILNDLTQDLHMEEARAEGRSALDETRVLTDFLKKQQNDSRVALRYPWIDADGRQCVCDGFQAYRMNTPRKLIERPADAGDPIDLYKVFPQDTHNMHAVKMPDAATLRAFIAEQRAAWTGRRRDFIAIWRFEYPGPAVNAEYLLNAARLFPDAAEIFYSDVIHPLYIRGAAGDGVVLPIRVAMSKLDIAHHNGKRNVKMAMDPAFDVDQLRNLRVKMLGERLKAREALDDSKYNIPERLNDDDRMDYDALKANEGYANAAFAICDYRMQSMQSDTPEEPALLTPDEFQVLMQRMRQALKHTA